MWRIERHRFEYWIERAYAASSDKVASDELEQ